MNKFSPCCHREIVVGHRKEFPLGGSTWYELYKIDICSCCGNEVEEYVDVCEECGGINCNGIPGACEAI